MQKFENIVANGEISHLEQFLLLPQYFQKLSAAESSESVYRLERVIAVLWGMPMGKSHLSLALVCHPWIMNIYHVTNNNTKQQLNLNQ